MILRYRSLPRMKNRPRQVGLARRWRRTLRTIKEAAVGSMLSGGQSVQHWETCSCLRSPCFPWL